MIFKDRFEAAGLLAKKLGKYRGKKNALILAIPRGALQTGFGLAKELKIPLGVVVTKKIGFPQNPEFAIGAVGESGALSLDKKTIEQYGISGEYIKAQAEKLQEIIEQRYNFFGEKTGSKKFRGKIVILVDDGIATGHTMLAAIRSVKKQSPKKIVVAVPVASGEAVEMVKAEADEFVCLHAPREFYAVGEFYKFFPQVTDVQAAELLIEAKKLKF